ncbi:peptidyl-prolyl cis-trans isomerase [Ectothiorhodospiraceae bacterium BW-2]|nr:peptidyl-prolyl cis-trans isomerase [Ectothiorhodospiraceae bacterium BW-2]
MLHQLRYFGLLILLLWAPLSQAETIKVVLTTNLGEMMIELYPDKAPKTVANFLNYVDSGFYEGTIFHRVIDDFMVQGGGYSADFAKKPTQAAIENEADNGLRNIIGTVAMARTGDPHSATSQFFINVANNSFLDFREKSPRAWGYAVFGRVVKGMSTLEAIKSTPTGAKGPFSKDVPLSTVTIESIQRLQE